MKPNLLERANKIRNDFQYIPAAAIHANKQFFDDVWNFCGAVIEQESGGFGQMSPPRSIMDE